MNTNRKPLKEIEKRIKKLNSLEKELIEFQGHVIPITKLTILKFLCQDKLAMCEFAYSLSNHILPDIQIHDSEKTLIKSVDKSLTIVKEIMDELNLENEFKINDFHLKKLRRLSNVLKESQNEITTLKWSNVRIIKNWDILLIEKVIDCFINHDYPGMGYELAKLYAERYDSRFGTGLIPESLKSIKWINAFWSKYFHNKLHTVIINNIDIKRSQPIDKLLPTFGIKT